LERNQLPNPPELPSSMAKDSTYPMKLLERKKSYMIQSPKLLQKPLQLHTEDNATEPENTSKIKIYKLWFSYHNLIMKQTQIQSRRS